MIVDIGNYRSYNIGGKASKLFQMYEDGLNIPWLICVNGDLNECELANSLREFDDDELFSVRSSSSVEDGSENSFAGQFDTYLNVKKCDVFEFTRKIKDISTNLGLIDYCSKINVDISSVEINVIIQKMVCSDLSGIIFTANPQGLLNEMVIVVGEGTGDNVVGDLVSTTSYYYNTSDNIYYYEKNDISPLIDDETIQLLVQISNKIKIMFDEECDIEFAIRENVIYILQARSITTLCNDGNEIILDNSNIVESYPNITLPLTQSFIREAYSRVFETLLVHMTMSRTISYKFKHILNNMVDFANGRVYYRISNWYDIILLLPFKSKIIPIWQEMLGVKNKKISKSSNYKVCVFTYFKTILSFFYLILTNSYKMNKLDKYFKEIIDYYNSLNVKNANNTQLLEYYHSLLDKVALKWDATLVNDMYTFIFTGLLKHRLKSKGLVDYETITNQYISNFSDIESMKPIEELIKLTDLAKNLEIIGDLSIINTNQGYYDYIHSNSNEFTERICDYIDIFGDRNIEELKLESRTFRTDPHLLVQRIVQYAQCNISLNNEINDSISPNGVKGFLAKMAGKGIRYREKSRLNRSRLYGLMRALMLKLGNNLKNQGVIENDRDIFWLHYSELEDIIYNNKTNFTFSIEERRQKYKIFENLPAYSRLVFDKNVFDKNPRNYSEMIFNHSDDRFVGIACSPGEVEGEVLLIDNPFGEIDTTDKILLTEMTDPGWVFLIVGAKGIISEKGSLLSHTAIISRELNKPAVVGVKNITKELKTGDIVHVNGNTGEIIVISRK